MNNPNTLNRKVPEGHEVIDLSVRGNIREWYAKLEETAVMIRSVGIEYIPNPNSSVLLIGPHAQGGITVHDPKIDSATNLIHSNDKPWESTNPRMGKTVVVQAADGTYKPVNPEAKEKSGYGDSLSKQLTLEIAAKMGREKEENLPNVAFPTISQAAIDANSGKAISDFNLSKLDDLPENLKKRIAEIEFAAEPEYISMNKAELSKDYPELTPGSEKYKLVSGILLVLKMQQGFRFITKDLAEKIKTDKTPLALNIHTAFDRDAAKGGNPDIDIVIGTVRGLSVKDFEVEVKLARFLKSRGFKVFLTSLFPPPSEEAAVEEAGVEAKAAYEGETERSEEFRKWAAENNVTPNEFERDKTLEELGRLRGTEFMPNMRQALQKEGKDINLLQLEVVRRVLGDAEKRVALADAIAEFSLLYDRGEI
jgi:hypothetical protein